jgi:hypothetical protein
MDGWLTTRLGAGRDGIEAPTVVQPARRVWPNERLPVTPRETNEADRERDEDDDLARDQEPAALVSGLHGPRHPHGDTEAEPGREQQGWDP